MPLPAHADIGK